MITIKFEHYRHDYDRDYFDKSFASMAAFKEWMFELMNQPYVDSYGPNMWFLDSVVKNDKKVDSGSHIIIRPARGAGQYWIYCVSDNNAIVFSNGKYTNGQCYVSDGFKAFMQECLDRRDGKEQAFVFGEVSGYAPAPVKSLVEQAEEFVNTNPSVAWEIYRCMDMENKRDDVLGKIADAFPDINVDELTPQQIDSITARFDKILSNNDSYYESYWLSAEAAINEFFTGKVMSVSELLAGASERSAESNSPEVGKVEYTKE